MEVMKFQELYTLDITNYIKKDYKGLKYLSWATAYKLALLQDPNISFKILENENGLPIFSQGKIHFVKTEVTMFNETKKMILPVMDNKHNAVEEPDSRDINDTIMRCLVKNIALFGLGLSLYVGEDIANCDLIINTTDEKKAKAIKVILDLKPTQENLQQQLNKYRHERLEDCSNEQLRYIYNYLRMKKGA